MGYKVIPCCIFVTLILLTAVYLRIWYHLNLKNNKIQFSKEENVSERRSTRDGLRSRKEKNFIKLAVKIVVAFMCCWLPFSIYAALYVSGITQFNAKYQKMAESGLASLIMANSLINPILYLRSINKLNFVRMCCCQKAVVSHNVPNSLERT